MPNLEYSEWIDTISLILTFAGIVSGLIYTQILQSVTDRRDLIEVLRRGYVRGLYQSGVVQVLHYLVNFYGYKESSRAFNVSLLLAYFYPFLFFVIGYDYLGGTNEFSSILLLPENIIYRGWIFPISILLLISSIFSVVMILNFGDFFDNWCEFQLKYFGFSKKIVVHLVAILVGLGISIVFVHKSIDDLWKISGGFFVGYVVTLTILLIVRAGSIAIFIVAAAIGLGFFAELFSLVSPGMSAFVIAVAFAVIFLSTQLLVSVSFGAGIFSIAITTFFFAAQEARNSISLMWVFFYFVLPLVNALLDWLSWWVSRWFLERTARESRARLIVLDVMLDFGAAILFMLALCLLLPAGAIFLDSLYADWLDVKTGVSAQTGWQEYVVLARDDPWGQGIMVTLMLVTTLIPTLLHILLGLIAFLVHGFKGAALASFLEKPRKNWRDIIASVWMLGYVCASGFLMWGLWQLFQYFAQLPIAQWLYSFTGYFYELP